MIDDDELELLDRDETSELSSDDGVDGLGGGCRTAALRRPGSGAGIGSGKG